MVPIHILVPFQCCCLQCSCLQFWWELGKRLIHNYQPTKCLLKSHNETTIMDLSTRQTIIMETALAFALLVEKVKRLTLSTTSGKDCKKKTYLATGTFFCFLSPCIFYFVMHCFPSCTPTNWTTGGGYARRSERVNRVAILTRRFKPHDCSNLSQMYRNCTSKQLFFNKPLECRYNLNPCIIY